MIPGLVTAQGWHSNPCVLRGKCDRVEVITGEKAGDNFCISSDWFHSPRMKRRIQYVEATLAGFRRLLFLKLPLIPIKE